MATYKMWQMSYDKWGGDLWGRLNKLNYLEHEKVSKLGIFLNLLCHKCSYCLRYTYNIGECSDCPLYKLKGCKHTWNMTPGEMIIEKMCTKWIDDNEKDFLILQKEFLQLLMDTQFEDED